MNYQNFVDELFKYGKKEGFEDMEVYFQKGKSFQTTVFKLEVDKYTISDSTGLSFRGIYNNKMGYSFTEILDEESISILVNEAKANALAIENDDLVEIAEKQTGYKAVDVYNDELKDVLNSDKIEFLKKVEKEALSLDPRIKTLTYNLFMDSESELKIANTKGLNLEQKSNFAASFVMALAVENGENKTGHAIILDRDFKNHDYKKIAKEVVEETVTLLGAKSVPSKKYEVIFRNDCAATLLGAFSSVFSADRVQKNLSLMKGKLNEKVASNHVTLLDDPFMEEGCVNISFDAEGTPAKTTEIIKDGVLNTFLHNLKTAKKDGVESTANASKGSYKSSIDISPSNLYIKRGDRSLEEMTSELNEGIIITKLDGIHAGLNPISGDFSLLATGFLVENGKVTRSCDQFTVAGNLTQLLNEITEVGNDLKFTMPSGSAFVASPSLRISELSIAGE